ncbi:protein kinase [Streptomyces sp. NPDC048664]|uniref:protein kinase n=1 Tax=Streptomyces sp. NPDC048664 TaxID=3154505 RepID=UPI00341C51D5
MDDYAGRVLADRYRLPLPPADAHEPAETRAFDTYSGQEVLIRQVPLPEVVEAEVLDADGLPEGYVAKGGGFRGASARAATRASADPTVRRAIEAAQAAARIPDHPRLDQVFDVFAEGGSLWVVSELVAARPLASLLAHRPLAPYRAAEIASDVLMALRVLHAHGWVHRNITPRTVLVCADGRVVLTGLAAGAAEEALCGYDPVPVGEAEHEGRGDRTEPQARVEQPEHAPRPIDPESARRAAIEARATGTPPAGGGTAGGGGPVAGSRAPESTSDVRAARAGAIAAYRAGARAAARGWDEQGGGPPALPAPRTAGSGEGALPGQPGAGRPGAAVPGQIADPYDTGRTAPSHGGVPRPAAPADPDSRHDRDSRPDRDPGHGRNRELPTGQDPGSGTGAGRGRVAAQPGGTPAAPWSRRGPATALAAERARQARMAVVGPVTERWAPEQAGPVHENWQLAAPIGPATDLWALGALLFRAVQGHAPYPEDGSAELVQLVCAEPPAYAEECGPLRPVVESLLRQDPTERPDVEELSGWLRSLIRSAPEPEAGAHVVVAPPVDSARLPIVRRRGELVRRRRAGLPATAHARHRRAKDQRPRRPGRLGRTLVLLILLALAAAIAYALAFMPKAAPRDGGDGAGAGGEGTGTTARSAPAPRRTGSDADPGGARPPGATGTKNPSSPAGSTQTQTSGAPLAEGFTLRSDPEGFRVAVADGWSRTPRNGQGQVTYSQGDFELIVVPGRDATSRYGADPLTYQRESEPELQPFRDSTWATSSGMRRTDVGGLTMAEGQFTWTDGSGRALFVRNLALVVAGHYHVVQVRGPEAERDEVTRLYEQAQQSYQVTG